MDRHEQFRRAAIDEDIPGEEVAKFTELLRFAVWAAAAGPGEAVAGQSGGLPRLPAGVPWPTSRSGSPLPFIASVDCAVLPRAEGIALPEDGTLLLFLHHENDLEAHPRAEEPEFARVLHVPAGAAVAELPSDHDTVVFHEDIPFLAPEYPLTAWVQPVLPKWLEDRFVDFEPEAVQQLLDELKHVDRLCELVDELWPAPHGFSTLRLGGYPMRIGGQDTPFTRMARANLGTDLPRTERFRLMTAERDRLNREWVPLAQFYTGSDFHYGCFLISHDDLAARRFDRTCSFTMFSE